MTYNVFVAMLNLALSINMCV